MYRSFDLEETGVREESVVNHSSTFLFYNKKSYVS